MKKKKIISIIVVFFIGGSMLNGCGSEKLKSIAGNNVDIESESMLTTLKMFKGSRSGYSNENGYYTIDKTDGGENIFYLDYKEGKQIYLCDKSECGHRDEKCTSFINMNMQRSRKIMFSDGKYLYMLCTENDADTTDVSYGENMGMMENLKAPSKIYKMNLDGSNRETLVEFNSGESVNLDVMWDGGEYIYLVSLNESEVKIDQETTYTSGENYSLIKISLKTGERKKVDSWNRDFRIIGGYEDKIIVSKTIFKEELSVKDRMDESKFLKALKEADESVEIYDLKEKVFKKLFSNKLDSGWNYEIVDNNIFYSKAYGNELKRFNLKDNKDEVFLKSDKTNIYNVVDGHLIVGEWTEEASKYSIVDIKNKKEEPFKLIQKNGFPVEIFGETKESLLVKSNVEVKNEYVEWAGVNQKVEINPEYSIISKNDFLNNKKNFRKVEILCDSLEF